MCYISISFCSIHQNYEHVKDVPHNTFGVVLGTSKYLHGGGLNAYFTNRIDAICFLFQKKKIQYIIVSGDNREKSYNEPKMMKNELIKRGIASHLICEDLNGISTIYSILRVYTIFHQTKFTVVSQKFHNERAIFIGNCLGLNIVGFNAKSPSFDSKIQIREICSRIKVFWDLFSLKINKKCIFLKY
ncbi:SanA/YdcF family protein [Blattabacterium cuenoti]|uniref:SanA/YdcF family protein n=1 Tax=Blattabacterium cuenoti TaxID=1653831 RepID=UPI001EEC7A05|nr:ElyC/SanA/YdcF family protein [Blattabacterium cuenoti]